MSFAGELGIVLLYGKSGRDGSSVARRKVKNRKKTYRNTAESYFTLVLMEPGRFIVRAPIFFSALFFFKKKKKADV